MNHKLAYLPFLMLCCCSTPEQPDTPEEPSAYRNSFYIKAECANVWAKDDIVYAYDAATGKQNGQVTEIQGGIGKNVANMVLSTDLEEGSAARLSFRKCDNILAPSLEREQKADEAPLPRSFTYSTEATLAGKGLPSFKFTTPAVFIKVVVTCKAGSALVGGKLNGAKFAADVPLSGSFTFDFQNGKIVPASGAYRDAGAYFDDPVTIAEGDNSVLLCCFPADLSGSACTVTVDMADKKGSSCTQVSTIPGRKLEAGNAYTISITPSLDLVTPADKSKAEYTYTKVQYKQEMSYKVYSTASLTVTVDGMNWMDKLNGNTLDRFGGYAGVKPDEVLSKNPADCWRVGRYKGHNVFINPDGNVTILHGINGMIPDRARPQSQPESQVEYDKKFSNDMEFAQWAAQAMADFGFNSTSTGPSRILQFDGYMSAAARETMIASIASNRVGLICNPAFLRTFSWDYSTVSKTSGPSTTGADASVFTLMFDPDFLSWIDNYAKDIAALFKGNRDFIGYYTDNELQFRWSGNSKPGIMLKEWIVLDKTAKQNARCYPYAQQYAKDFMTKKYGVEPLPENVTAEMESAFLTDISEYYYSHVTAAMRKYDPDHLLLGSRLHGAPQGLKEVTVACAKYNDVLSTNIYHVWEPDASYYTTKLQSWIGNFPCIITEFYTRNEKQTFGGVAYCNDGEGGGWIVTSQEDRGRYYENFTRKAISFSNIAGWQWFQTFDDFLIGYGWNNKGVITPDFKYYGLYPRMRRLHWNIYQILDYYCGVSGKTPSADKVNDAIWVDE